MATKAFRLRPIMKQGTAAAIPETWTRYPLVEEDAPVRGRCTTTIVCCGSWS